jgi:hypothetical protein
MQHVIDRILNEVTFTPPMPKVNNKNRIWKSKEPGVDSYDYKQTNRANAIVHNILDNTINNWNNDVVESVFQEKETWATITAPRNFTDEYWLISSQKRIIAEEEPDDDEEVTHSQKRVKFSE